LRLCVATDVAGVIDVGEDARSDDVDIALLIAVTCIGDDAAEALSHIIRILSATSPSTLFLCASFIVVEHHLIMIILSLQ
jgi:hypothetical protein